MTAKRKRVYKTLLVILILLTLCFIWGNSLLDREESTEVSSGVMDLLRPLLERLGLYAQDDHILRELAHVAEFGLLGMELAALFLLQYGLCAAAGKRAAQLSLLTGVTDELLQMLNDRSSQLLDVGLDFLGACLGIGLVWLIARRADKKRE